VVENIILFDIWDSCQFIATLKTVRTIDVKKPGKRWTNGSRDIQPWMTADLRTQLFIRASIRYFCVLEMLTQHFISQPGNSKCRVSDELKYFSILTGGIERPIPSTVFCQPACYLIDDITSRRIIAKR
jgi:hypothetical protein